MLHKYVYRQPVTIPLHNECFYFSKLVKKHWQCGSDSPIIDSLCLVSNTVCKKTGRKCQLLIGITLMRGSVS